MPLTFNSVMWSVAARQAYRHSRRNGAAKTRELQRLDNAFHQLLAQKPAPRPVRPPLNPARPQTKEPSTAAVVLTWLIPAVLATPFTNGWSLPIGLILAGLSIRGAHLQRRNRSN